MDVVPAEVRQLIYAAYTGLSIPQEKCHRLSTSVEVIRGLVTHFGLPHPPPAWYTLAFQSCDSDGDGYITAQDTLELFAQYYATPNKSIIQPARVAKPISRRAAPGFGALCLRVFHVCQPLQRHINCSQMEAAIGMICRAQGINRIPSRQWFRMTYDNYASRNGITADDLTDIAWKYCEATCKPQSPFVCGAVRSPLLPLRNNEVCVRGTPAPVPKKKRSQSHVPIPCGVNVRTDIGMSPERVRSPPRVPSSPPCSKRPGAIYPTTEFEEQTEIGDAVPGYSKPVPAHSPKKRCSKNRGHTAHPNLQRRISRKVTFRRQQSDIPTPAGASSHQRAISPPLTANLNKAHTQELAEMLRTRLKAIKERYGDRLALNVCRIEFMNTVSSHLALRPPPTVEWVDEAMMRFSNKKGYVTSAAFQELLAQYCEARTGRPSALRKERDRQSIAVAIASHIMTPAHKKCREIYDDYEFQEKKGEGSFGEVWRVVQKRTGVVRACKSVQVCTEDQLGLIETEIDLMKSLDHPNVLKLFEYYYDQKKIYLVVEYCQGQSLSQRVNQKCDEKVVKHYIRGILAALAYCHRRNIIHRDIKPDNVLLLTKDEMAPVKVIDFGLSDFLARLEKNATIVIDDQPQKNTRGWKFPFGPVQGSRTRKIMAKAGTAHYMAPEVHRATYNERADVFSCGVIMYELITGIHPFFVPGVDTAETARDKILTRRISFKPVGKGPHADFCRALLEHEARKRPTAEAALGFPWCNDSSSQATMSHSVYDNLRRFQKHNKMKQAVLRLLAKEIDEASILHLRAHFVGLDKNSDGMLTYQELHRSVQNAVGAAVDESELQSIVTSLDADAKGGVGTKINYQDFIAAMLDRNFNPGERHLAGIFARFVSDDNVITRQSLKNSLCHHSAKRRSPNNGVAVTAEDLNTIFLKHGTIDFNTFCRIVG